MDIISYALAKKHQKMILKYHKDEVGFESEAEFSSLDHRLDELERLLEEMRINNRLEISTLIDGLLSTRLGTLNSLEYTDDNKQLRLVSIGKHFKAKGYWESPVLDIFDGFEKVANESRVTTENSDDKITMKVRTAESLYEIEHIPYVFLNQNTQLKKYAQIKMEFSSSNLAPSRKVRFDFSNKSPRISDPDFEKENWFYHNHFIDHSPDEMKIGNIIDAFTYPNKKYQGEGYVYEVEFFANEFRELNGIEHKNFLGKNKTGPGPQKLIAGDLERGFYGEVDSSEIFTAEELSNLLGITEGQIQFNDIPWLKWAYKGKTLFRPKKAFRSCISWDHINSRGAVYGGKVVEHEAGYRFDVRLMRGAATDPNKDNDENTGAIGSEWNDLMLPIHIQAKDASWAYPKNVEDDVPYWGIDYTDEDLNISFSNRVGSYVWCQETSSLYPSSRVYRGNRYGVSFSSRYRFDSKHCDNGWAPVLELITD